MNKLLLFTLFLSALITATYFPFSKSIISSSTHQVFKTKDHKLDSWSLFTLSAFPGYAIRTKKPNGKLCDEATEQVVGYLDTEDDKHFFFWFFESRNKPDTDPLILWLNGGPGCSSLTGLLMELGPCRVQPGGNATKPNPHSWNNNANVIFLDQPINAGFSYSDSSEVSSSEEAAEDVYAFLQLFLNKYDKYSELDFHVSGESYAGHYIPAIAKVITESGIKKRKSKKVNNFQDKEIPINLKSLAIGNGLTDPLVQYEYYPDMACNSNYGPILSQQKCDEMRSKVGTCTTLINACYKYESQFTCVPGSIYCNNALIRPVQETGKNLYDVRTDCQPNNPLCYAIIQDIETYMNLPHVQKIIGVDREFKGCNMDVNMKFLMNGDWMKPFVRNIPDILEMGIDVLIYAGDADYICNWMGNKAWTLDLEWSGKEEYNSAQDMEWTSRQTGKPAGEYRAFGGFAFLRVFEAGHMVPYDQPEHSSEFIDYWIGQRDVLGRKGVRGSAHPGRREKHHYFYKH